MNPSPSTKSCLNEGCTGTKPRSLLNEMRRRQKDGVVTRSLGAASVLSC